MHQIKCILCGKTIDVDYKSGIAACPYCDTVFELPEVSIHPVSISQHDDTAMEIDVKDVHECENCGARIDVRDNLHDGTLICPYCDTHYRVAQNTQPKSTPAQKPDTSSLRKPIYTNWAFWLVVLLFLFSTNNMRSSKSQPDSGNQTLPQVPDWEKPNYSSEFIEHNLKVFDDYAEILDNNSEIIDDNDESMTISQTNALRSAESYLLYFDPSYKELIEHLEYKKYSHEDAVFAADNCGADWFEEALESAKSYLSWSSFSYDGLIHQLEFEQFTSEQARYAVDNCGADWFEQAAKCAESYLQHSGYSRDGLIDLLLRKGFTQEQAEYAAEQNGY